MRYDSNVTCRCYKSYHCAAHILLLAVTEYDSSKANTDERLAMLRGVDVLAARTDEAGTDLSQFYMPIAQGLALAIGDTVKMRGYC